MNIVIFTHELPFPASHGGRIDVWNRLKALKRMGHKIFLVAWAIHEDNSKIANIAHVERFVDKVMCYCRSKSVVDKLMNKSEKLFHILAQPNIVTECSLSKSKLSFLYNAIREFDPDFVLSDGIYAAKTAFKISNMIGIPFFIRSHNIEHVYVKKQIENSNSLANKFKFWGMGGNLESYEFNILKSADAFFDISLSDLKYWQKRGLSHGHWMPPVYFPLNSYKLDSPIGEGKFDIGYIGNLYSPTNLKSLGWFFEKVLPEIKNVFPLVRVLVAGLRPTRKFEKYCEKISNVTLFPNPENIEELYESAKILMNPILSGSGVNVKTIEMIHYNKEIVCTSQAIAGLPIEIRHIVNVADDYKNFASLIVKILKEDKIHKEFINRDSIKKYFNEEYLGKSMFIMNSLCEKCVKVKKNMPAKIA